MSGVCLVMTMLARALSPAGRRFLKLGAGRARRVITMGADSDVARPGGRDDATAQPR